LKEEKAKMKLSSEFSKKQLKKLDEIIEKYKDREGALISVLHQSQELLGYLPVEIQEKIAQGLNLTITEVYGVVTFYNFFTMVPRGKYIINSCQGTACYVRGGKAVLETIKKELDIKPGGTTEDRVFSLETIRCMGACALAPVVRIGDNIHRRVSSKKVPQILAKYRGQ